MQGDFAHYGDALLKTLLFATVLSCIPAFGASAQDTATTNSNRLKSSLVVRTGKVEFSRWEEKIQEFEKWDQRRPPKEGKILFAGASSVVLWKLDEMYPEWRPIKRGFGGSFLPETTFYAERTIIKHRPRVVVLYTGENDIARDRTPAEVVDDFKQLVQVIQTPLPETTIVYLAIKPTRLRWRVIDNIRKTNAMIRELCESSERLEFVDTFSPILGEDGKPREELFQDKVHLNVEGYKLWDERLRPVLQRVYQVAKTDSEESNAQKSSAQTTTVQDDVESRTTRPQRRRRRQVTWLNADIPQMPGLTHKVLASKSLGHDVGYVVWTPAQFDANGTIRYPVIYFLHGAGGSEKSDSAGFSSQVAQAIQAGRFPPSICVFPNGGLSGYRNEVESMIVDELIPLIDKSYPTKAEASGRVVCGFSMGGAGSVHLSIRHPELFCGAGSWGGALAFRGRADESPLLPLAKENANALKKVGYALLTINGDQDRPKAFEPLKRQFENVGISHTLVVLDDTNHNLGKYYERSADTMITFLAERLRDQVPAQSPPNTPNKTVTAVKPSLGGPWIRLVGRPPLEKWASQEAEPVDFTVFQADNGRWQLISCIRHTKHPGGTRLLYRWSSPQLTQEEWRPEGIFLSSKPDWSHAEGKLQAPFHVRDAGKHLLFYNSRGAHLMTSSDGISFEPVGNRAVFPMGRDVCVLDDRGQTNQWIAYYTSFEKGINSATRDHTIRARTASELTGPWSDNAIEIPPITPPPSGYEFVYAESPLVIKRGGYYFRFEQLDVYRSSDPFKWSGPPVARLAPQDPLKRLAPEIVTDNGKDYLVAYQWRGKDPRGIYLAPLKWHP